MTVFTIGHSTHPLERFLALLQWNGITAIGDVRSTPYSRMNPQFDREALKRSLSEAELTYVYLGKELGARSDDPKCYENGRVQYDRIAATPQFQTGLARVREGSKQFRLALMCAEKEPLECHRTLLVSRHLAALGITVQHILAHGSLESHTDLMTRLRQQFSLPERDLFRTPEEVIEDLYRLQEKRIAYVSENHEVRERAISGASSLGFGKTASGSR